MPQGPSCTGLRGKHQCAVGRPGQGTWGCPHLSEPVSLMGTKQFGSGSPYLLPDCNKLGGMSVLGDIQRPCQGSNLHPRSCYYRCIKETEPQPWSNPVLGGDAGVTSLCLSGPFGQEKHQGKEETIRSNDIIFIALEILRIVSLLICCHKHILIYA